MRRWLVMAAVLMPMGAAGCTPGGDVADCNNHLATACYRIESTACQNGSLLACRHLAEQEDDQYAQVILGIYYANGRGVPQDYVAAATWYRKAAAHGEPRAQNYLGELYENGRGVPKSD